MSRLWTLGPPLALALVTLLFTILVWASAGQNTFGSPGNLRTIAVQSVVVGTTALGMTLVIVSGGIDLSVGAVVALSSVVVAATLKAGGGPAAAALAGIGSGALCGALNGSFVAGLRVLPFIVTLGTMLMIRGVAKGIAGNETIHPGASTALDSLLRPGGPGVWILLGLAGAVAALLRFARFGRHAVAVGSNEAAARLCGVPVARTKLGVYALGGLFAGVSGLFQYSRLTIGDPSAAPGHELDVVAAVVIGGASLSGGEGSVLGSLVGALIMTVIRNGCSQMGWANWITEIVAGVIIIASAALDRLRHRPTS
jgi:ribose/xylose/arabinose/galactoside ABC-type transport system permease subunit